MSFPQVIKDPDSTVDFIVNWSKFLGAGSGSDSILSVEWILPEMSGDAHPLVTESEMNDTTVSAIWLSGGTEGVTYSPITCRIHSADGRIEDFSFALQCVEK